MKRLFFPLAMVMLAALAACNKNDNNATHTVTVRLTDNPLNAEEVNVDVQAVELKYADDNAPANDNADDSDETRWISIPTEAKVYNLLDLQNGVNVVLAKGPFTHDRLQEIRLKLGSNNSIKIGGVLYPLTVPSGSSSGYKIKVNKTLADGNNEFIVDFDAAQSVHVTGSDKYMLQPVLVLK